jgi:hypothetical protein
MAQERLSGLLCFQSLIQGISLIFKDPMKIPQRGLDQLCEQHLPLSLPPLRGSTESTKTDRNRMLQHHVQHFH